MYENHILLEDLGIHCPALFKQGCQSFYVCMYGGSLCIHCFSGGEQCFVSIQCVRARLRPGTYHGLVLTELQWICRTGAQGDGSLLNALSRKCYMCTLQYTHRGTLP